MHRYITSGRSIKSLIGISLALLLLSCNESDNSNFKATEMNSTTLAISETIRQSIKKIKDHRILFAHHSVGGNLIDGMNELAKESGIDLKIENINNRPLTIKNMFVDFSPGKNTHPITKIDSFLDEIISI